jgi:hypothetical protein
MKKTVRYFLVLVALSVLATAFAEVGGYTRKTGNRQSNSFVCELGSTAIDPTLIAQCVGL